MIQLDVTDMQLPSNSFDLLICYHVLEHVSDDRAAMAEMHRVLKPRGSAIIQVPMHSGPTFEDPTVQTDEERFSRFGQRNHVRLYGRDIKKRIESAGFHVEVVDYLAEVDEATTQRSRLRRETEADEPYADLNDIYCCRKRDETGERLPETQNLLKAP